MRVGRREILIPSAAGQRLPSVGGVTSPTVSRLRFKEAGPNGRERDHLNRGRALA
jgi:hypothetical protein